MADSRLHQGQASERDVNSATARVAMDDLGGTVSGKMQVLFPAAGGWNFFWTPKEGDHVVLSKLPNGVQEGYILGKVYTGNKMPQNGAPNIILIVSDDGKNVVRFDADNGTLDLIVDQDASLKCKNLNIEVSEKALITAKNTDITVEETANIEVKDTANITVGTANIEAAQKANINSPKVTIESADVEITGGNFSMKGTVSPAMGPLCAIPNCLFTGAPHGGNKATGT
jgi:phage baseplate assembly protein gpV